MLRSVADSHKKKKIVEGCLKCFILLPHYFYFGKIFFYSSEQSSLNPKHSVLLPCEAII